MEVLDGSSGDERELFVFFHNSGDRKRYSHPHGLRNDCESTETGVAELKEVLDVICKWVILLSRK